METDCRNQSTWAERLALFVERKWNMGHAVWAGVYLLASLVLLPAVLILSAGTGMAILAYLTVGLYGSDGHTATTTLAINVFCTVVGWFVCCWWCMVIRLFYCHLRLRSYRASCGLPMAGLLVLAELTLFTIALFMIGPDYCIYLAAVPVALMLLVGCVWWGK